MNEGGTYAELAEESGVSVKTLYRMMKSFREEPDRIVHICGHAPDVNGRIIVPIFKLGSQRDVKRKPPTGAERQRKCRENKRLRILTHLGRETRNDLPTEVIEPATS